MAEMEMAHDYRNINGKATAGLTTGIIGTAGWLLNGGLGNIFGGMGGRANCASACSENMPVDRYDLSKENEIVQLKMEKALLESNIYTDSKIADVYERLSNRIASAEAVLAQQAIRNQGFTDAFREIQKDIDYKVALEAERRQCADCKIVDYSNSTFATKLVTEYGAGTTSAPLPTYNPLDCGSKCGCWAGSNA